MNYKTPGVYTEEISLFPPSVAQVATAIPAFIGYTETGPTEPTRITSMLEYEQHFGGPPQQTFEVVLSDDEPYLPQSVTMPDGELPYLMYYALQMFFANGGGVCHIVSVGDYDAGTGKASLDHISDYTELKAGLDKIRKVDEVTLIIIPEATRLLDNEQYDLYKDALMQCGDLKDRFGIFDVRSDDLDGAAFRNGIGTTFLSYGAAYYPHLNTSLQYNYRDEGITFNHNATNAFKNLTLDDVSTLAEVLQLQQLLDDAQAKVNQANSDAQASSTAKPQKYQLLKQALSNAQKALTLASNALEQVETDPTSSEISDARDLIEEAKAVAGSALSSITIDDIIDATTGALPKLVTAAAGLKTAMDAIQAQANTETGIVAARNPAITAGFSRQFVAIMNKLLNEKRITLPPASTIAGIYAAVDNDRGVWKSPANVSINRISGPAVKLTFQENDDFNVHPTGKSINVIRAFTGKGTLVWGARTLDGNSNEWRYISVRRFFNMVEESVKKATQSFVFEANDANTWVKVKAMIENFLVLQWRAGALMGAKPEEAFFVKVGLGETMTQQNVLDGEMIVEIGMAAVRPAEFIILRFSHKMLES